MARSHPGVWSVLDCFIGLTKEEIHWTQAQQILDSSCGILDTKAHPELLSQDASATHWLDRQAKTAVFLLQSDGKSAKNGPTGHL